MTPDTKNFFLILPTLSLISKSWAQIKVVLHNETQSTWFLVSSFGKVAHGMAPAHCHTSYGW